jgi:hypothetical protein
MTPAALALLDRRLARLCAEHGGDLSQAATEALSAIALPRRGTVSRCLEVFRSASAAAQRTYGEKLHLEVMLVVQETQQTLTSEAKSAILQVVSKHLNDSLYDGRFQQFEGAIGRHFGRAGIQLDLAPFRPDLARALYDVGSKNFVQSTLARLGDDLELVVLRTAPDPARHQPTTEESQVTESKLEQANRLFKIEPNVFGIGVNLNYLFRRILGKKE